MTTDPVYSNEQCPARGPGLNHTMDGSPVCTFCGAPMRAGVRPIGQPTPFQPTSAAAAMEDIKPSGLIDGLLARRSMIDDPEKVSGFFNDPAFRDGYKAGIDAALDYLVPAMKQIVTMPVNQVHGVNCIFKPDVEKIVGKVPLKRAKGGGWTA